MYNLLKPEYLWRPTQILRRLSFKPSKNEVALPLPWLCTINVCSAEAIGRSIATQGLYDLPVTEAIVRLADSGDVALDVGANIGYMSLVLALSTGPRGRVTCFEPNADVLPRLRVNVGNWATLNAAPIQIQTVALSDQDGRGQLGFSPDYAENCGVASLDVEAAGVAVEIKRLDSLETNHVGLMKLDVEGHEASVLDGARNLLGRKLIRDIVFEESEPFPAKSHRILLGHGYRIFRLTRSNWRPLLLPAEAPANQSYLPPNYVATINPSRAEERFRHWGWHSLSTSWLRSRSSRS